MQEPNVVGTIVQHALILSFDIINDASVVDSGVDERASNKERDTIWWVLNHPNLLSLSIIYDGVQSIHRV